MSSYQDMQTEIAEETDRSHLSSQIARAILSAVRLRSDERFWFNETRDYSFSTIATTDTYTLAPDVSLKLQEFITIDYLEVLIGGQYRPMNRVSPAEMAASKQTPTSGQPLDWALFGDEIQIYPTPNDAYTVRVAGHFKFIELDAGADENAWTSSAYDMIKNDAKAVFYTTFIREHDQAASCREVAEVFRAALQRETSRKQASGTLRPWC